MVAVVVAFAEHAIRLSLSTLTLTVPNARYFSDLGRHLIPFAWAGDGDGDSIDMAFNKTRVPDRKDWLVRFGAEAAAKLAETVRARGEGFL